MKITAAVSRKPSVLPDLAGHYRRPDTFQLGVNRRPRPPVVFDDGDLTGGEAKRRET